MEIEKGIERQLPVINDNEPNVIHYPEEGKIVIMRGSILYDELSAPAFTPQEALFVLRRLAHALKRSTRFKADRTTMRELLDKIYQLACAAQEFEERGAKPIKKTRRKERSKR